jgi:hypothetical protein
MDHSPVSESKEQPQRRGTLRPSWNCADCPTRHQLGTRRSLNRSIRELCRAGSPLGNQCFVTTFVFITARPVALIGDENAITRSRLVSNERSIVMQRRHFKQAVSLHRRLADEAQRLRKEAQGTPPGVEREQLIRRARQAETASHMSKWMQSPTTPQ